MHFMRKVGSHGGTGGRASMVAKNLWIFRNVKRTYGFILHVFFLFIRGVTVRRQTRGDAGGYAWSGEFSLQMKVPRAKTRCDQAKV